jgi:hypothetical protein
MAVWFELKFSRFPQMQARKRPFDQGGDSQAALHLNFELAKCGQQSPVGCLSAALHPQKS